MRKIILLLFFFTPAYTAFSQNSKQLPPSDTSRSHILDEVVVTGQYKPQSVRNTVFQIRTIHKEKILKLGALKLQDVLNYEMNIRFTQDLATGGSNITMMGLSGQNVKVLLDGLPLVGRQGANNAFDINQIDVNTIERIEIIEGPMSVIYGADALAGVINIITKKAAKGKLQVGARLQEETVGNEYSLEEGIHNQAGSMSWQKKQWEMGGGFTHNYHGGWKDTAIDRELVWHKKDQMLANGFIGFKNNKINIRYRMDGLDEVIVNPGNFLNYQSQTGDTLAYDQEYLSQRMMHQLQAGYEASQKLHIHLQTSYTDYSRQVFSTTLSKNTGDVRLNTSSGSQGIADFSGLTVRAFANYRFNNIIAMQPGVDVNIDRGEGDRMKEGNNAMHDYAFFATAEFTPNSWLNIRPGLRFISNSVYDAPPIIPSVNAKIKLTDQLDIKLAYANGFRSPSLRELYFDFFDASHQIVGNPDLKAETSNSFTAVANWKFMATPKTVYAISFNGFYNKVHNLIDYGVSPSDPNITTLLNVAESKSTGANASAIVSCTRLNASLGGGYTGFYNDLVGSDHTLPALQWSPEMTFSFAYSFPKLQLDLNLFYKFTGKRPYYVKNNQTTELAETEGYHMADFTINKKMGKLIVINLGIRNLFDVSRINSTLANSGVHGADGTRNIGTGRGYFGGILFNWTK